MRSRPIFGRKGNITPQRRGCGSTGGSSIAMNTRFLKGALLATTLGVPAGAALAQDDGRAILTMVPQQLTARVENYNPFNSTTVLPTVQDFMYEPLVIFTAMHG